MTHDEAVAFLVVQAEQNEGYARALSRAGLAPGLIGEVGPSKFLEAAEVLKAWEKAWDGLAGDIDARAMLSQTAGGRHSCRVIAQMVKDWDPRRWRSQGGPSGGDSCDHRVKEGDTYDIVCGHGQTIRYLLGPDGSLTLMGGSHRIECSETDREVGTIYGGTATLPYPLKCVACQSWVISD